MEISPKPLTLYAWKPFEMMTIKSFIAKDSPKANRGKNGFEIFPALIADTTAAIIFHLRSMLIVEKLKYLIMSWGRVLIS